MTWEKYASQLDKVSRLEYNYDADTYHSAEDKSGWFIDKYHASLGCEAPGYPSSQSAFEKIKQAMNLYQFPDPGLIYAVFNPDLPLLGRNMYMVARFFGMTFNFGVRVVSVIDDVKELPGGAIVKRWGYAYRTLKGHFEVGEISFIASKNINTGEIVFDIEAYSKPDRIANAIYRWGFKIFGRSLQRRFAKSSIERLKYFAFGTKNSSNVI